MGNKYDIMFTTNKVNITPKVQVEIVRQWGPALYLELSIIKEMWVTAVWNLLRKQSINTRLNTATL